VTGHDDDERRPDPDDDAVRRLLADARHTGPIPADVAARMDDVLADLAPTTPARGPAASPGADHPTVVSLSAHRRRRAARMLVAAAAIVVGGVVVAQHLPNSDSPSAATAGDASSSADSLDVGGSSTDGTEPETATGGDLSADAGAHAKATVRNGRVVVRPQHFTSDAVAARRLLATQRTASRSDALSQVDGSCVVVPEDGKLVNATYERAPAVLFFHRPVSSAQVVDLFVCGSSRPVRSATLPHP
jgi:hypothetical protein